MWPKARGIQRSPGGGRFLFGRVVITMERSDAEAVFGHAVCVCLSFSAFRKVAHLHGQRPWHPSLDGPHLVEIKQLPN